MKPTVTIQPHTRGELIVCTIEYLIDIELLEEMQPIMQRYTPICVSEMVHLLPRELVLAEQDSSIAVVYDSPTEAHVLVATENSEGVITLYQAKFTLLPGCQVSVELNLDNSCPDVSKYQYAYDCDREFYGASIYQAACKLYEGKLYDATEGMMEAVFSIQVTPFDDGIGVRDPSWIELASLFERH